VQLLIECFPILFFFSLSIIVSCLVPLGLSTGFPKLQFFSFVFFWRMRMIVIVIFVIIWMVFDDIELVSML